MVETGLAYARGDGVAQDQGKAVDLYRKGIEAGINRAMLALGDAYENGKGVAQDMEQAVYWYHKAAETGTHNVQNAFAMHCLSRVYRQGAGVEKNMKEAISWLWQAAELGDCDAMLELSRVYEMGEYRQRDMEKADSWRKEAAEAGNDEAIRLVYGSPETEPNEKITQWKRRQGIVKVDQPIRTPVKMPLFRCGLYNLYHPPVINAAEMRRFMRYTQEDAGQRSAKPTGQRMMW